MKERHAEKLGEWEIGRDCGQPLNTGRKFVSELKVWQQQKERKISLARNQELLLIQEESYKVCLKLPFF